MPARREAKDAYDALAQARVETIGSRHMAGVASNLRLRLSEECEAEGYDRMTRKDQLPVAAALALLARERMSGEASPPAAVALRARDRLPGGPSPPAAKRVLDLWRDTVGEKAENALDEMARTQDN